MHSAPRRPAASLRGRPAAKGPAPGSAPSNDGSGFSLFFDSRSDVALDGVRAVTTSGDVIHLAYAAEGADLVLDVMLGSTGLVTVAGQVLTHTTPAAGFAVSVQSEQGASVDTQADAAGRFRLPALAPPVTHFVAVNGPVRIDLPLDLA